MFESEQQFGTTLHLELYTARAEHFVGRTDVKLHIRDVKFRLVVMLNFADFLLPVAVHDLPLRILVIFLLREHVRRRNVRLAYARTKNVRACLRLILNGGGDVLRIVQVERRDRRGQVPEVLCAELVHLCGSPDGRVGIGNDVCCLFGCGGVRRGSCGSFGGRTFRGFPFRFLLLSLRFLFRYQFA